MSNTNDKNRFMPEAQGLYDPAFEKDACGVGFIVNVKGVKSHKIVKDGMHILERLAHRGATAADPKTSDGAGLIIQMPHEFMIKAAKEAGIKLPDESEYGAGLVFLPQDADDYKFIKEAFEKVIKEKGQELLGWRKVPVDNNAIGYIAREKEPRFEMIFIKKGRVAADQDAFERKLYVIRKKVENIVKNASLKQKAYFYVTNISSRTLNYKGLMMPEEIDNFFPDLKDESLKSAICFVHSRYSTNTFPTWDLAQPFRYLAHNGEINTLRGNINWMRAKEGLFQNELFGDDLADLKPVIRDEAQSDSATTDNAFEILTLGGRSMTHAILMLVPGAWEDNNQLPQETKDFYNYNACFMEPWDGPAALCFTDGHSIGAVLDRNGLRPAKYLIRKDGCVVMSSEVGVLDDKPEDIEVSGRLEPGKIFYIDTKEGRIVNDAEIKHAMASRKPYGKWIKEQLLTLDAVPEEKLHRNYSPESTLTMMKAFGFTREDLKEIITPLAVTGHDPTGSMGNDMPHAVFSKNSQPLYLYFKQLFAQVTNPPIDSTREKCVMSLNMYLGKSLNMFTETPEHAHKLLIKTPLLTDEELLKIKNINTRGFRSKVISILFDSFEKGSLKKNVDRICDEAVAAVKEGYSIVVLSDKGVTKEKAAIPSLMAVGAVHHELVRRSLRTQISIVIESAEPREVHHFCMLLGYGADAFNPYGVYEAINHLINTGVIAKTFEECADNFRNGAHEGMLKIIAKMGISTMQSYCGAQIFEAIGIQGEVIDKCFAGTVSRIGGAGFDEIETETVMRHREAFPENGCPPSVLKTGGVYQWKKDGEFHLWNPDTIAALQDAAKHNDGKRYAEFTKLVNDQSAQPVTLRSVLKFKKSTPVSIEEVEPAGEIVKRFVTGAMSFGAISRGAHEAMAIAMNRLGGKSNTGEGGEDPARFKPFPNGDSARSATKQVASGRFGVTTNYLANADEIQIKMAQGAKPGEGGQLPGHKVSEIIARTRYTTPGVTLISPPPHHDIYSIEDLKQLIFDLKNTNPRARISVKLVSEVGVGTIAAGVAKGFADMILISGFDGGTGASPKGSIMNAGLPWELGLSETHQTLVLNDLRSRVRLQTDGQMRTGRDVVIAAMLGAEEYGFATSALIVLGCVMLRHCHLNNCSVGVNTQDELLEKRFRGSADDLINYFMFVANDARAIMAELGIRNINELIGRCDMLEMNPDILPWKAKKLDLSKILYRPQAGPNVGTYFSRPQKHEIDSVLDRRLIKEASPALERKEPVRIEMNIKNTDRTAGAMLSGEICHRYGELALNEDTIKVKFTGYAGQSFGAWLTDGVTLELEGMANDYVGKGITGGKIIIYPSKKATYKPEDNMIVGNTTFYGAIRGEAYIRGRAGERFCIRNSGLYGVVEGTGDHGCEYMTGGKVVILGTTGRNFAAGMSGGEAYVYDEDGKFGTRCNKSMVDLDPINEEDARMIKQLLANHIKYTSSDKAARILDNIGEELKKFIKVYPKEYKAIVEARRAQEKKLELTEEK
jgi:glutamate synthase domain-containing protein 2/glutamate synthase domain-containing protein 1/glutamate synthase domain-containing protein 3